MNSTYHGCFGDGAGVAVPVKFVNMALGIGAGVFGAIETGVGVMEEEEVAGLISSAA